MKQKLVELMYFCRNFYLNAHFMVKILLLCSNFPTELATPQHTHHVAKEVGADSGYGKIRMEYSRIRLNISRVTDEI